MDGILVPISLFGMIAAIVLVPIYLKERTKQSAHQLISRALEQGQTLDPQLMAKLTDAQRPPPADRARRTLGSGVVLLALAAGFVGASYMSGDFDPSGYAGGGLTTAAMIVGCLGLAFIILAIVDYSTKKKTPEA